MFPKYMRVILYIVVFNTNMSFGVDHSFLTFVKVQVEKEKQTQLSLVLGTVL